MGSALLTTAPRDRGYRRNKMTTTKITIGDSSRGYDSAEVTKTKTGKYRLVPGSVVGRESVIRKSIASLNRGDNSYVTSAGDSLEIRITNA